MCGCITHHVTELWKSQSLYCLERHAKCALTSHSLWRMDSRKVGFFFFFRLRNISKYSGFHTVCHILCSGCFIGCSGFWIFFFLLCLYIDIYVLIHTSVCMHMYTCIYVLYEVKMECIEVYVDHESKDHDKTEGGMLFKYSSRNNIQP